MLGFQLIQEENMKSIFILIGIVAAWYILNRWILPRFGVET
jgi:hypothetical protein